MSGGKLAMVGAGAGLLLALSAEARAEPARRLVYERGAGAERCPDEDGFRRAVAARLGEDPFTPDAPATLSVRMHESAERLWGRVELFDEGGRLIGARDVEGEDDCEEVAAALALATSLAINPNLLLSPPDTPPKAEARPGTPAPIAEKEAPPEPARRTPEPARAPSPRQRPPSALGLSAGGLAVATLGTAPSATFGGGLVARGAYEGLSLVLTARADAAAARPGPTGGTVSTQLLGGMVAPCAAVEVVEACVALLVARMHAEVTDLPGAQDASALYAAAGAELAVTRPVLGPVLLRGSLDLLATLTPNAVTRNFGTERLWTAPKASAALGLAVLVGLP